MVRGASWSIVRRESGYWELLVRSVVEREIIEEARNAQEASREEVAAMPGYSR